MKKYEILKAASQIYKILGALTLGIFALITFYFQDVTFMILGGVSALGMFVFAELLGLAVDIAENIGKQTELQRRTYNERQPMPNSKAKIKSIVPKKKRII